LLRSLVSGEPRRAAGRCRMGRSGVALPTHAQLAAARSLLGDAAADRLWSGVEAEV